MARPNRAMAHVAKNPWEQDLSSANEQAVEERADELRKSGHKVRVTSRRMGPKNKSWRQWTVWKA